MPDAPPRKDPETRRSDISVDHPFRFVDNREKYLLFVTTCNEKQVIAERVAMDVEHLQPVPPALRIFDAGMGDATVLTRVMRYLHRRFPNVPFLIVAKEISQEDVRIALERMADRFYEHPLTVLAITNLFYSEAPSLLPRSPAARARLNWVEVPLEGGSAHEFGEQIQDVVERYVRDLWQTAVSPRTGNLVYLEPSVLVMYRKDHAWPLAPAIPSRGDPDHEYDLVIAAQPFRARASAELKVKNVLAPLTRALAPGGSMIVIQSTGRDPGMEIIRRMWPGESPFQTPRQDLLRELAHQMADTDADLRYLSYADSRAQFRYSLQLATDEVEGGIGTSTVLAAWNAATYVAQIEDDRILDALSQGEYLRVTSEVLSKYNGLWFADESFIVARRSGDR